MSLRNRKPDIIVTKRQYLYFSLKNIYFFLSLEKLIQTALL